MLNTIALSQKSNLRVFKYDENGTGVKFPGIFTVVYPGVPEADGTPDVSADLLEEKDTW